MLTFESQLEKIGMPALGLQIVTGLWMAYRMLPDFASWFRWDNDISILVSSKVCLLALTLIIALHARFRVIPTLSTQSLNVFAVHIVAITLISVGFVVVGSLFRTGLTG
ncbi:CopD family protein [Psychrobacter lutiphocae]|uniref:CopD family protein n=1 Tax=Psychrobacter lutiphocae TaxID=540500 RepID=UPI0012EA1043|nr:CopD family protein [Psychrobacter lutiphocae]